MSRRAFPCFGCKEPLGKIAVDRFGGEHLNAWRDRVKALEPLSATVTRVTCLCGRQVEFAGTAVHLVAREEAA